MQIRNVAKRFLAVTILVLMAAGHGQAATITGGSTLLDSNYANQLESWLGEGSITLTNIFTKTPGNTATDFHNAVDGKGRTFVVMSASENGTDYFTIGGYNPQSWNSGGVYNYSNNDADRTAFLFNLSSTNIYRQNLYSNQLKYPDGCSSCGQFQTFNYPSYGPTFGGGHDLHVEYGLNYGFSLGFSYGGASLFNKSIIDGSYFDGYNVTFGGIEVFTISSVTPVPEPEIYAMMGLGLGLLGWVGRRKKLQAA
jgi:hypothetical protein